MPRDLEDAAPDAWAALRPTTPARIGLARTGDSPTLDHVLDLQIGHAKARDAVHLPMDVDRIVASVAPTGQVIRVRSLAPDRVTYLRRPDQGRMIDPACLSSLPDGPFDVVFVLADGLSSVAVERHGASVLTETIKRLDRWRIAPVVVATQARVALADPIGERMRAAVSVILIGERPGLSVADSLGAYLTFGPRRGRRDSERNCISNIHATGLAIDRAADKLAWLMTEARARGLSGVALKDETPEKGRRLISNGP